MVNIIENWTFCYSQTTSALGLVPMFGSCSNFEVPIVLIPSILPRSRRPTQCPAGRSPEGGFSAAGTVLVLSWSGFYATLPSSPRMGRGHWMSSSRGIYRLCAVSSRSSKCPEGLVTVSSLSPERCAVTSPQSSASWLSFLDWRVMCLPNRETNYELCHQLTGLDHLEGEGSASLWNIPVRTINTVETTINTFGSTINIKKQERSERQFTDFKTMCQF